MNNFRSHVLVLFFFFLSILDAQAMKSRKRARTCKIRHAAKRAARLRTKTTRTRVPRRESRAETFPRERLRKLRDELQVHASVLGRDPEHLGLVCNFLPTPLVRAIRDWPNLWRWPR